MAKITVVGAGMMGSALCAPLVDAGNAVRLVGTPLDKSIVTSMSETGMHPRMGTEIPPGVQVFDVGHLESAVRDADVVVLGVSSSGMPWACQNVAPLISATQDVFMITKGLVAEEGEIRVLPDVFRQALSAEVQSAVSPAAIAGPCIAGELARRVPSCVVLTGRDEVMLERTASRIRTPYYHVWTSTDVMGVEACAALKNAYAMGVAFGAGLHLASGGQPGSVAMHNVESAVFGQALFEMRLIVEALGGDPMSVGWLPGAGDLDVTNNGGRTGRFGRHLGRGLTRDEAIEAMEGATLECLSILDQMREATRLLIERGRLAGSSLPLLDHMIAVALDGEPVNLPFGRFFGAPQAVKTS